MTTTRHLFALLTAVALSLSLAACGGGGGADGDAAATPVGSAGGRVGGGNGFVVEVPPGALAQTTMLKIEQGDAGAPPLPTLPAGMELQGSIHALTPHGTVFSAPAELSLPRGDIAADERVWLLKTNADQSGWQQIEARIVGDRIVAPITRFSHAISVRMCSCAAPTPPVISTPPRGGEVDEGGYVLLTVDAIGDGPLAYQWLRDGARLPGETGRAIVINPVTMSDDGMQLSVQVTNADNLGVRSAAAVVKVRPLAPRVVSEPQDVQARVGGPAEFRAGTTSGIGQTLQWQRSDDGGSNWTNAPSRNARLDLAAVSTADDGALFRLRAENARGSVLTREARLTVLPRLDAPVFTSITPFNTVSVGQGTSFVAIFSGAELEYRWERRDAGGSTWTVVPGADSATLTLAAVTLADDGTRWRASARNATGNATSPEARLDVHAQIGSLPQRLSGGRAHSLGLGNDGRLWGWGSNLQQQLAPAASGDALAPLALGGWDNVAAFAAGSDFNLVLLDSGVLYGWGGNRLGEAVYFDPADSVPTPQAVFGTRVFGRAVAAGTRTALAMGLNLPSPTIAWGTGYYGDGRLAFRRDEVPVPRRIEPTLVRAALGDRHALGITATGGVVAWGYNGDGRLGLGHRGAELTATPVPTLAGIVAVAVGEQHSLALTSFGQVLAWGGNAFGQLGGASADATVDLPRQVPVPAPAMAVASGRRHVLVLTTDGRLYAWGHADRGQVGHGVAGLTEAVPVPREISAGWARPLRAVAAGDEHSLVLDAAGVVWAWGANDSGQLGDGTRADRAAPAPVQGLTLGSLR